MERRGFPSPRLKWAMVTKSFFIRTRGPGRISVGRTGRFLIDIDDTDITTSTIVPTYRGSIFRIRGKSLPYKLKCKISRTELRFFNIIRVYVFPSWMQDEGEGEKNCSAPYRIFVIIRITRRALVRK